jgi:hypothetical protein
MPQPKYVGYSNGFVPLFLAELSHRGSPRFGQPSWSLALREADLKHASANSRPLLFKDNFDSDQNKRSGFREERCLDGTRVMCNRINYAVARFWVKRGL